MAYYEINPVTRKSEKVTASNIITALVGNLISADEAIKRINGLLFDMENELLTLVDKEDWRYIYNVAKEEWAKYDGRKPSGDDLKEIRKVIKEIIKDELKIEKNGDFRKLNKLTYHRYKEQIEELLYKKI